MTRRKGWNMEQAEITVTAVTSVFSALLSLVVGYLAYRIQKAETKREEDAERQRRATARRDEEQEKSNTAMKDGLKCILRDRLITIMQDAEKDGYAPLVKTTNATLMHDAYKTLGGNGVIEELWGRFRRLPGFKNENASGGRHM